MTTQTELLRRINAARGVELGVMQRQATLKERLESQANARIKQSVITGYRYHKTKFDWVGHAMYTLAVMVAIAVFYGIVELI